MFSPMNIEPQLCADDKMSCWAKLSMAHGIFIKCWMIEKLVERKYLKTGKQQFVLGIRLWWGNCWRESNQCCWFSLSNIKYTLHPVTLCLSLKAHGGKPIQTHSSHSFGWIHEIGGMIGFYLIQEFCLGRFLFVCVGVYLCQAADFLESAWNEKLHIFQKQITTTILWWKRFKWKMTAVGWFSFCWQTLNNLLLSMFAHINLDPNPAYEYWLNA